MKLTQATEMTQRPYAVFMVNSEGVRAAVAAAVFVPETSLESVLNYCRKHFDRYVILNALGVQIHASDERDTTGAYLPPAAY